MARLHSFLQAHPGVIHAVLSKVRGSSPRDAGTEMFVAAEALFGTIGGGQLEYRVIEAARGMLGQGDLRRVLDLPLGPEIGQCCGGRVEVTMMRMSARDRQLACTRDAVTYQARPHVYILGAGHVGRGMADLLQHLPVRTIMIDTRRQELTLCMADVETRLSALPELDIAAAPTGSAFVVLTHDHGLDFLLASQALGRGDAAYVGMIGSASKRAKFTKWCESHCAGLPVDGLICPVGAGGSNDKRPAVIAATVVAEVIGVVTSVLPSHNAQDRGETYGEGARHFLTRK